MKEKFTKNLDKIFAVTAVISLVLIIVGASFLIRDKIFVKNANISFGYVSHTEEIDGKEEYIFTYTGNQQTFNIIYKYTDKNTYPGETIKVYYKDGEPEKVFFKSSALSYASLYAGTALLLISLAVYLPLKKRKLLLEENMWTICKVKSVEDGFFFGKKLLLDSSKVAAKNGKPFVYGPVSKNKAKLLKDEAITVYYHAENPKIYFVDIKK